jgi:hypothetical protein
MILEQRVFYNWVDISTKVNTFKTGFAHFPYLEGEYLYIASILPFNNIYIDMKHLNDVTATVRVEMNSSNGWKDLVDVIDETDGLKASGRIQWNTDEYNAWYQENYSKDVEGFDPNSKIFDMYWVRLSWNADLKPQTEINYVGQKFSSDRDLYIHYSDLNDQELRDSFFRESTPGTEQNWEILHFEVADIIVKELKKRNIIKSRGQILDHSLFTNASVHKVAELIYTNFGRAYFDQKVAAREEYKSELKLNFFNVDTNKSGRLEFGERKVSVGTLSR